MQSIDSEVQNFQQKMSKSMHSLMQAFNEGFEAMEKAKKEEGQDIKVDTKKNEKRVTKMNKIHSGMANLEALTSKLKMSFGDDEPENKENL
jgi:translation initiation factor 1 (eIF-1/SUI1)